MSILDHDSSYSDFSEENDVIDMTDEEGWQDIEPDVEVVKMKCLKCSTVFEAVDKMLVHCKKTHDLDLEDLKRKMNLDFLGLIKLVNYVRSEVKAGNFSPKLSNVSFFQDERYLLPVLEDDPLLYSLDLIDGTDLDDESGGVAVDAGGPQTNGEAQTSSDSEAGLLAQKLQKLQLDLQARDTEVRTLQKRLGAHEDRLALIQKTYLEESQRQPSTDPRSDSVSIDKGRLANAVDSSYFASYSGHDVHATMLKDKVRTDAYRDFIYENKHLFEDKTVLDVGCGTGILSMFCARAGAAKVFAVDNSDIIDFARENIYKNNMVDTVICLRGKIEEVNLPTDTVDIIVSEWMGYCLLYEAMLDSVLWARNRYLKADGHMVPAHCTLRIAPLSDPEYIDEYIHHWKDVYGFDMSSMSRGMYSDALVQPVPKRAMVAESTPFLTLDLKRMSVEELEFAEQEFMFQLSEDIESLDGFVIWFDTFFLTMSNGTVPAARRAEEVKRGDNDSIAFTTGPFGEDTHWHQGVLLINHGDKFPQKLKKGKMVHGTVGYQKRKDDGRALDIRVRWELERSDGVMEQTWSMR